MKKKLPKVPLYFDIPNAITVDAAGKEISRGPVKIPFETDDPFLIFLASCAPKKKNEKK